MLCDLNCYIGFFSIFNWFEHYELRQLSSFGTYAKNFIAQLASPSVTNKDVHGSNPFSSFVVTIKISKNSYGA